MTFTRTCHCVLAHAQVFSPAELTSNRDQWLELKGSEVAGYTYDAHKNLMLKKMQRAKKQAHNQSSC